MSLRRVAALLGLLLAAPASARGWEPAEGWLRLEAVAVSDLFPGYVNTASDRGLRAEAHVEGAVRTGAVKLGLAAEAGALAFARFSEARQGWLGAEVSARRGGAQLVAEGQWTPHQVKFPAAPEDAAFRRWEGRLGLRQSLPGALRLRLEGRIEDDDYLAAFDSRDAVARTGHARLDWSPGPALTLRLVAERGRTVAVAAKYRHDDGAAGGGLVWSGPGWRLGTQLLSTRRRYDDAGPSDSNFRRRDQGIELGLETARALAEGLELRLGATLRDLTSTRPDRTYTVHTLTLGLQWAGGGD